MDSTQHTNPDFRTVEPATEIEPTAYDAHTKAAHARRVQRGIKWMGVGALLLLTSFLVNFLCFQCGQDFAIPMYVLTSVGAGSILKGMVDVF